MINFNELVAKLNRVRSGFIEESNVFGPSPDGMSLLIFDENGLPITGATFDAEGNLTAEYASDAFIAASGFGNEVKEPSP